MTRNASRTSKKLTLHRTVRSCQYGMGARKPRGNRVSMRSKRMMTIARTRMRNLQPPAPVPRAEIVDRV